jgi:hypothetical protein
MKNFRALKYPLCSQHEEGRKIADKKYEFSKTSIVTLFTMVHIIQTQG